MVALGEAMTPVSRPESVQVDKEYRLLGIRLDGNGPFLRETKLGAQIAAPTLWRVEVGDFIYSRLFAWRGAFGVIDDILDGSYVSGEFPTFRPLSEQIDIEFLRLWFRLPSTLATVEADCTGSTPLTRNRFKEQFFLAMQIPLPPLDEQRRIVAQIEALAARIEQARGLRQETDGLTKLLLPRMVSNLRFQESDWTTVRTAVSADRGSIRTGPFGSQLHHEEFVDNGIPAIGTRDVQVNTFVLNSGWYVTQEKFEEFKRYQVFPGDVLATIVGASIGRFCVVPENIPLAFTTKHILALTLNDRAMPEYLSYILNFHERSRSSLFSQVEGSAQPSLNSTKVLDTAIPLPQIIEQQRIVAYLDDVQARVEALKQAQAETQAELAALLPSVLDRAFRGEL
jgi:type I restriction enzyme S subunit